MDLGHQNVLLYFSLAILLYVGTYMPIKTSYKTCHPIRRDVIDKCFFK